MRKKLLSILLSFAMVITMMPMMTFTAFADEANAQAVVMLKAKTSGKTAVKLSWTKVDNATKYVVYGNKCGSDVKKLITVKTNSYTVKKIENTKLKANKTYRFYVVAYNGETTVGKSKTIHFITGNTSGKYANASKITATAAELNLEIGTSGQVGAEVEIYNNKNHLPSSHGAATRYVSKNPAVATVSSKGKVTAVSEGTTTIYIQDIGGLYCKTTVNVIDNRDRDAVESYKQEIIAKCEALSKLTDTKGIKTMIADAKSSIESLTYDKTLTLEENKAAVDAVYTGLVEKVKQQRIKQGLKLGALTAIIGIAGVTGIIIHKIKQTPEPPTPPTPTTYTVTFDLNGIEGTAPEAQKIEENSKVKKPTDPTDTIHTFAGWYKTKDATTGELSDPWDFDTDTVTADMTLYAHWTRTMKDLLGNDFPRSTGETISPPENAWTNENGYKAYIYSSDKRFKLDPGNGNGLACLTANQFTRISDDKYVFKYVNGSTSYGVFTLNIEDSTLVSIEYNGAGTSYEVLSGTYTDPSQCIAAGTMISMPGGQQKAVEDLEIGDIICTFDHETGKVSSAPVAFIWESENVGNAFTLTFEDDIEVTVIEEHGFYDQEEQKYVFINLQNAEEYIGDHFYNADSNSWLVLKGCKALNDSVDAYAIITSGHLNHMSNGMLSMCDGSVKVLANIFEYDNQMKFDADKKKADIEAYGLTSKEKISEFEGFLESDYDDYNLQYLNVAIGKGLTTWEWMKAFSDYCVANGL